MTLNVIFILINILVKINAGNFVLPYMVISVAMTFIIVWSLSPVEAKNKPLKEKKRAILRVRSIGISIFNIIFFITIYLICTSRITLFTFYFAGALTASLLLVAAAVFNKC